MEVNVPKTVTAPKQLHRHALPIVVLAFGALLFSIVSYSYYVNAQAGSVMRHALIAHLISVQPERNGLAKFTIIRPAAQTQTTETTFGIAGNTAGQTVGLGLAIQQTSAESAD